MDPSAFGPYRVDAPIGTGGMGAVYRAFDTRLNRAVALKIIRREPNTPAHAFDRLLREARAASSLNHPNIVTVHDVGETAEGEPFIVEELIEGHTLRSLLAAPLALSKAVEIGTQVARALAAAHAAGIVHRDVKPENVMIRSDGLVKVLDFGLARRLDSMPNGTNSTFVTASGVLLGTPAYMAPEQCAGADVDSPCDVFSLGVLLYEMVAGRRPFAGSSVWALVASIQGDAAVPIVRVHPEIPPAFDELVLGMLAKRPEQRPSAADVVRRLAVVQAGDIAPVRIETPLTDPATTVGREAERGRLRRAFERVKHGRGLIVGISGEAGIGKTSLIEAFLDDLRTSGERPTIVRGRCSENLAGAEAYLPILELLEGLVRHTDGPSCAALVKTVAPTWYAQVQSDADAPSSGELRTAPPASQERMKRELAALFQDVSRLQPLVVFIDDLHWADVSTIDIVNYLAARFSDLRVLIVASYRPSDMALAKHPFLGIRSDLQSRGLFEEATLRFLELHDVERYIALQFPGHALPADLPAKIHAKTEGSPLFMADLVRYLRDTGSILEEDGRWVLARGVPDVPRDLPESVRGMIARKIEQVDEVDRRLLLAASVQGHEFDSTSIAAAAEMSAADVEDRLDVLERVHVFVKRGEERTFPDGTLTLEYRFVHVLYQNVLYGSLQPTRRARMSASIAGTLASHHGGDVAAVAARLALLYETARDLASAAKYFHIAARRAVGLFAFREALSLAERGLDGVAALPETPARQQLELRLQMVRGLALRSARGWAAPDVEPTFARARELCSQLQDPPELFPVMWSLGFFADIAGNVGSAHEQAVVLMRKAEETGTRAHLVAAHHLAGTTSEFMGDVVTANRLLERARELHDPAEHGTYREMFGMDPGMIARIMSSRAMWALGYPDQALERSLETLGIARSLRTPVTLVFALVIGQCIRVYRGEMREALAMGEETASICTEYEFPQEAAWARGLSGSALAVSGKTAEGAEMLEKCLATLSQLGSGVVRTYFLGLHADALWRAGRVKEGLASVEEGLAHAERTKEDGFVAELHRARGHLWQLAGNDVGAEDSFRTALAAAAGRQARSFELRAATALARHLRAKGRGADARAILPPIVAWFTEGHTTADLIEARTLLSEIG